MFLRAYNMYFMACNTHTLHTPDPTQGVYSAYHLHPKTIFGL